jgi:predicted nucleic acid-binding Zn ribbon protein
MRERPRGKLEALGSVLGDVLRGLGLDRRMREFRAVEVWNGIVGETIAQNTRPVGIRDGVLFVEVASSVWMQELVLLRGDIAARLNEELGETIVRRIVLTAERDTASHGEEKE